MTATELKTYWHAAPFVPFNIILPGSEILHVPHPDFIAVAPNGRIAHVWKTTEDWVSVDVMLITAIEQAASSRKKSTRKG